MVVTEPNCGQRCERVVHQHDRVEERFIVVKSVVVNEVLQVINTSVEFQVVWIEIELETSDEVAKYPPEDAQEEADVHDDENESQDLHHVTDDHQRRDVVVVELGVVCQIRVRLNDVLNLLLVVSFEDLHNVLDVADDVETGLETHELDQVEESVEAIVEHDDRVERNQG